MPWFLRFIFALSLLLAGPLQAFAVTADITAIDNRAYAPAVEKLLMNAKTKITIAMYSFYLNDNKDNPVYTLANALVNARQRGVEVTVYLDQSHGNRTSNSRAANFLTTNGINTY